VRSDRFREAVEASDLEAFVAAFAPNFTLRGPVNAEPLVGKDQLRALFEILFETFEDLRFTESFASRAGGEVLHFVWRLGDSEVEGVDMLHFDDAGLIDDYRVMVRPLSAVRALEDAVWSRVR